MSKLKITLIVLFGIIVTIFGIVIFFNLQTENESTELNNKVVPDSHVLTSVIDKQDEHSKIVLSEILQGNYGRVDSMGIKNAIPSDYNDFSTLIEFRTFEKQSDGTIRPYYVSSLKLLSQVTHGEKLSGGTYGVKGYGLRLGLADKLDWQSYLLYDTEYTVYGSYHLPEDPNKLIRGRTSELRFRTPKSLAPGEIYRVDLILVDRIKEQQEQEQTKIAKEERARIEKEEAITIQIKDFPKYNEPGIWMAGYHDGNKSREFQNINNMFILKGPNKLGGDLAIYYNMKGSNHVWLYTKNIQKRTLQFPEDASVVLNDNNMVSAKISLSQIDPNILSNNEMIAFYPDTDAKYFLFWISLKSEDLKKIQDNNWQIDMKFQPGTYYVKLIKDLETFLDLGIINIVKESRKTYSLNLK